MAVAEINLHYEYGKIEIGDLMLESGTILPQAHIAYERVGSIGAPVILVCHGLTGNQFAYGNDGTSGWWSGMIGPYQWIDTNEYQVITTNVIGGCNGTTGPLSINPDNKEIYRASFPFVTIRDMVHAQYKALRKMGIDHVHAVIGGSLGGMQVLEWGILYPTFMDKLFPLAATSYLSDYAIAFNAMSRFAIIHDPKWNHGNYPLEDKPDHGLSLARMLGMITYRSQELYNQRFQRSLRNEWGNSHDEITFEIESYLSYQGDKLTKRFDANSYLYLLKAMDSHDIGRGRGGWKEALKLLKAPMIAIAYKGDLLYPPESLKELTEAYRQLGGHANFYEIDTIYGHDGFLVEFDKWGSIVKEGLYGID
ncbi:homoserine O-acetyltransferase MetX [Tepidibacillus decaturensis]|uniref:Homoserine O-acetyltransferase n=1 Tax=Tepidibacillus decaturensis TaxID=1413211 RepID=A0A135L6W1_9BACI|nr:homoserine O-acetyltransferase [Tepidibacillus decaturensis]KXG44710.1 homoserine O-acetyltransferase [Tepidibacillus decaturensis]